MGNTMRVLIVDSGEQERARLLASLKDGGAAVYSRLATCFAEVASAMAEETWDIVLLNCMLPQLAAEDALDGVRAADGQVPVILVVERGSRVFPAELLENGAQDFVFKSNLSRLLPVIERECANALIRQAGETAIPEETHQFAGLSESESRFLQLAGNIPECYWMIDAESQRVTYISSGYSQIWGRYVEALYSDSQDWLRYLHEDDRERVEAAFYQCRQGGLDEKFRVIRPDGSIRWLHARNFPIRDDEGHIRQVGGIAGDITHVVMDQGRLAHLTHFDALTALPNQLMFYSQARTMLALSRRVKLPLGIMVVDIDRFRGIVEAFGHAAGDELLRQVAGRLSGFVRESDSVGRLEGDVFAVVLSELAEASQAAVVAGRVLENLAIPMRVEGQEIFATVSIGLAFHPHDGASVHELVSCAQLAMRHAKQSGRNTYAFFSPAMHESQRDRLLLETDLRNGVLREEFVLHYQPKVSCVNGKVTGAEALVRWHHPRRGIVPPDEFIPLLEETGLIIQVGRWVLNTACKQAMAWRQEGLILPSVAVNLSARQLQYNRLCDDVACALEESGLPAECLDLEITESMLMVNAEAAISTLTNLKAIGVTISLDDFGTGYSSLAYLKRFPLDAVKVDRSFVQDITADSDDASITRAVITMAHHLKLKVVAEGVETAGQLAMLISHQCDVIQGYFFSRPLPDEGMTALLQEDRQLPLNLLRSGTHKRMTLFAGVEGYDEVIAALERAGHRVCLATDEEAALRWFAGNLADVLVCGYPRPGFDPVRLLRQAASLQPQCERILLADAGHWEEVGERCGDGTVHRIVHLPVEPEMLRQVVEDAVTQRGLSEDYSRLSHEVEVAERQLLRVEEERRRLESENRALRERDNLGYAILQEVMAELPWPMLGVDAGDMLVLVNEAAEKEFKGRQMIIGSQLQDVLPEAPPTMACRNIEVDGRSYKTWWRDVKVGTTLRGRLLLLQKEES